jgi:signal transduction histidine kinase
MVLTWGPQFTQFYNDAYAKLIGSGHPAALGNDIRITLAEGWATLGPMIDTVMKTGIANWTPALPLLMERSGYREEAYFSVSHAPAENDEGEIVGMLAVCSEVTAQVVGERRLRLLRELSSRSGDVQDFASTCEALGLAMSADPLDIPFAAILLETDQGLSLAANVNFPEAILRTLPVDAVITANMGRTVEVSPEHPRRGGLWGDVVREVKVLPLEGRMNEPAGVLVAAVSPARELDEAHESFFELLQQQVSIALRNARAFEDERKRAEELAALDKAKTDFFSNVSHEFRTPLTLMLGPLEGLIAADPAEMADMRSDLDLVYRNALRLLRLVNTLLEFSRVEARRVEAHLEATDLAQYTEEVASSFRSAIEQAGLRLDVNLKALPHPVRMDRDMWEKIVLNLISNALKHTHVGSIALELAEADGQIRFVVADTGSGISADNLPRVFERFHRIENQRARSFEGTGIGLALVRELAELLGGNIAVESEVEVGTRFTVSLPITLYASDDELTDRPLENASRRAFIEEAAQWVEHETPQAVAHVNLPKVLLADDNTDMRNYVARLLERFCEVTAVADGEAALDALEAKGFDLVITDIMMPRLDGFELIHSIRASPKIASTPVIMLSARAGEDSRVDGLEAGADDYLVKPFSAKELVARVRANLELSRMRRELAEAEARVARLEAIGQLTGGVAHDFNNLLTAVSGSLELLSRRVSDRPDLMRFVSVAQTGAARGAKLTSQLLAFARRQPLSASLIDINTQLREFLPLLQGAVGDSVELVYKPDAIPLPCKVDPRQLEVAVLNLVINARDASQQGGKVVLSVSEGAELDAGLAIISVSDEGHGMSSETLDRAVEPFFTTKDVGAGTGLGLSQVYGFSQQSGGSLKIASKVGEGTTVRILLPLERSLPAATTNNGDECMHAASRTILLVEDEQPVRLIAAEILKDAGYTVIEAANGPDAIKLVENNEKIDILVSDVSMPQGMSGVELARAARALLPQLPVLLTSGYAEVLSRDDHGFPLLPKPYAATELIQRLEALLAKA